jgi:hypothetical protein
MPESLTRRMRGALPCQLIFAGHLQHKQNASPIGLQEGGGARMIPQAW